MTTLKNAEPRDLIALAWYRIGVRPRESLVLVGLRGPRRRTGLVTRVDLPEPQHRAAALRTLMPLLRRDGAEAVVVLVVSDADGGPHADADGRPVLPHGELVPWLRRQLERGGIELVDALAVGPSTFRSYLCQDPTCCPPQGESLELVAGSALAAEMVLQGRRVLQDEDEVVADVRPVAAGGLSRRRLGRVRIEDHARVLERWRRELAAGAPAPAEPAELLVALRDVRLRDAVLFTLVPGSGLLPERLVAGEPVDAGPRDTVWAQPPDHELADRGQALLAGAVRLAPVGDRAQALAVLAWLAWWRNDAVRCRLLVELALTDRPDHRLAALVAQLHAAGIPPTWWRDCA